MPRNLLLVVWTTLAFGVMLVPVACTCLRPAVRNRVPAPGQPVIVADSTTAAMPISNASEPGGPTSWSDAG
jgi:hypothetical protein